MSVVSPSNAAGPPSIPSGPGASSTGTSPMVEAHPSANNEPDWFVVYNPDVEKVLDVKLDHTLKHESIVCCVRFSADGKLLATGCNHTAQIYDVETGRKVCVLVHESMGKHEDLYIRSVCFRPDGKYLATGAEDKQIRIWDIQRKKIRNIFDGYQQEIYSLDFSADGRLLVCGSGDKTARIWDMVDGTSKVLTINDAGVTSVAISPNGKSVAAGSLDAVVRMWEVATGMLVERLRGHGDSVYSVAFTPDGKGLVGASLDKILKYWDVEALMTGGSGSVTQRQKELGASDGAAAGPNEPGESVAEGALGEEVQQSSRWKMDFVGHKAYAILSVALSHDGRWVASGSKDRTIHFWDSKTAVVQAMLHAHKNTVISVDLSPTTSMLATGSGDCQARIWLYN
ncbi:transcriptional repressor rco-1 [Lentinula raphanica]|nr:transcriptional repressor rco-1 [Lentinula raphanica]